MRAGPSDPVAHAAWRGARREVAREHHPDVGGDPATYVRLMGEVDARFGRGQPTGLLLADSGLRSVRARRLLRRAGRRAKRGARGLRGRLPRQLPGSRRYLDL